MPESSFQLEKELNLPADFSPPSYEEWRAAVEKELKGVPFEKKLVTRTYEGIDLQPIYTSADLRNNPIPQTLPGYPPFARGASASGYQKDAWLIAQELPYGLAEEYNDALRYDLQRGMNCVVLPLDLPTQMGIDADYARIGEVGKYGVSLSTLLSFSRALQGVDLAAYPLLMDSGFSALPMLMLLKAYLDTIEMDLKKIRGCVTADPLGFAVLHGQCPVDFKTAFDEMALSTDWMIRNGGNLQTIGISGLPYHNAGATAVQELAAVLATAVEYLHQMTERGLSPANIMNQMRFTFGVGSFYFMEIAKLRAARILWSQIAESYSVNPETTPMLIHACTSTYNMTQYDPHANTLRATTEAFSAVIGGANSLCVLPYDAVMNLPDEFARRLARNTQIILREEANLRHLIDPAGGSYFVESLTAALVEHAWAAFREIEKQGGMLTALRHDWMQSAVRSIAEQKQTDVNKRKSVIVGVNMYANPIEELPSLRVPDYAAIYEKRKTDLQQYRVSANAQVNHRILEQLQQLADRKDASIMDVGISALKAGATLGEIVRSLRANNSSTETLTALPVRRAATLFESLRSAAEQYATRIGHRPEVFLATMGPLAQYKARADFSKGFFEIGGFRVIYPSGFSTPAEAAEAALRSNAAVIVICSTDETYPELVPAITRQIKSAKPDRLVVLAGYPKDQIELHRQAGVDEFIYLGADAVYILSSIQKKTGVLS